MDPQSNPSPGRLSAAACDAYRRDGVLFPLDALSATETRALRARIEEAEARSHGRLSSLARTKPHLLFPFLWDLVHDARIVDAVASLLGEDIYCLGTSLIDKPAGSDDYVAWHQDATFWGLSAAEGATAWLAISDATAESGCMEVLPGTHLRQEAHLDTQDARNMLGAREALRAPIDLAQARKLVLRPGQMSLHHPLVMHGSAPNLAGDRRLGFVIRYIPAHVRQEGGTVTLVRGRNLAEMDLEQCPEAEMHPEALKRHAEIIRRGGNVIRRAKQAHLAELDPAPEPRT
jgi:non-heme Fe2+,alpha-ketoglutarate-dependent halogenase